MKLCDYMEQDGLRQNELADALGVTRHVLRGYLTGSHIPRPDVMGRIIKVTGGRVMPNDFYPLNSHEEEQEEMGDEPKIQTGAVERACAIILAEHEDHGGIDATKGQTILAKVARDLLEGEPPEAVLVKLLRGTTSHQLRGIKEGVLPRFVMERLKRAAELETVRRNACPDSK